MSGPAPSSRRPPAWDAPITVALLVVGVLRVTQTVATARTLPATLDAVFLSFDLGSYTSTGLATAMGWAIAAESTLLLVAAIGFAVPRLRQHRTAFWIPLVAAAANFVITLVLAMIAVVGDPAFAAGAARRG